MPDIIIVAGPNGAGKTSFGNRLRRLQRKAFTSINADEIEAELGSEAQAKAFRELAAARLALRRLDEAIDAKKNVMIETTLAARTYARRIPAWRNMGYKVALVYLRLPSADHAVERVRRRVALSGHDIPEEIIRRRFELSLEYLEKLYKPVVDEWYIWDSIEGNYVPAKAWDMR
jgi:predicted ABC-type ATPase